MKNLQFLDKFGIVHRSCIYSTPSHNSICRVLPQLQHGTFNLDFRQGCDHEGTYEQYHQ